MAKAPNKNGSDGEERKPGEQSGLDSGKGKVSNYPLNTRVVLAVNAAS